MIGVPIGTVRSRIFRGRRALQERLAPFHAAHAGTRGEVGVSDARCEEFRELVSAFVDERLDGGELLRLEEHLQGCAGCRAFEGELRRFKGMLRAAEVFRPLRRPPPGFAATVAARIERQPRPQVVPFPEVSAGRRLSRGPWIGMAAAAAAAALFFAWSWQRLVPVDSREQKVAVSSPAPVVDVAAAVGGSMDTWMREHAMVARDEHPSRPGRRDRVRQVPRRHRPGALGVRVPVSRRLAGLLADRARRAAGGAFAGPVGRRRCCRPPRRPTTAAARSSSSSRTAGRG